MKACIFDMDGVIVDSAKYHFLAWQRLAQELSITFTEQDNEALKGLSRVDSLERILTKGHLELDNNTKLALMDKKNAWYLEYISNMQPEEVLPGVRSFLQELKDNNLKIALGSSSKNAKLILEKCDLEHFFDSIIDGTKVTFSKPDPEVFLRGATEMEVSPKECVVFEDAIAGVEAANKGGFFAIGVGEQNALPKAQFVIPGFQNFSLQDLVSHLAE